MLIYNQAFDIYHCIYRFIVLLSNTENAIEIDKLRILDFYFVFPNELQKVTFPSNAYSFKKHFKNFNKYEVLKNPKRVFDRMKNYQQFALSCMKIYDIIDSEQFKNNLVLLKRSPVIDKIIGSKDYSENITVNVLTNYFAKIKLYGSQGLKERTKLIDTKYDAI